jgi:hypothetical protein
MKERSHRFKAIYFHPADQCVQNQNELQNVSLRTVVTGYTVVVKHTPLHINQIST